jgi:hypothetical protein
MFIILPVRGGCMIAHSAAREKERGSDSIMAYTVLMGALEAVPWVILVLCIGFYKNLGRR